MTKMVKFYLEFYYECSDHITWNLQTVLFLFFMSVNAEGLSSNDYFDHRCKSLYWIEDFYFYSAMGLSLVKKPIGNQKFLESERKRESL